MTWTPVEELNKELAAHGDRIMDEPDERKRWRLALGVIASGGAHGYPARFLSTMAMVALYPEDYKALRDKGQESP